jgi:hypothetical protein
MLLTICMAWVVMIVEAAEAVVVALREETN